MHEQDRRNIAAIAQVDVRLPGGKLSMLLEARRESGAPSRVCERGSTSLAEKGRCVPWYNTVRRSKCMRPTTTLRFILCQSPRSLFHSWCHLMALHHSMAVALLLVLTMGSVVAQNTPGSNKHPFTFGSDQT